MDDFVVALERVLVSASRKFSIVWVTDVSSFFFAVMATSLVYLLSLSLG